MASDANAAASSLERRIASLEAAVRALTAEVEQLRSQRESPVGATSMRETHPPPVTRSALPPHTPPVSPDLRAPSWIPSNVDLESLVGRYGTLVLATVSALAAVGIFLGWAIEHGLLGPKQRIALGLLVALALGMAGLRLRRRERSFGASLLGLALAIVHVCAWGVGPSLQIAPTWVAFLLAALASIALAVFAHAENDEPLWCVGFIGAAIAPFVTSSGKGNVLLLTAYGVAVLGSAGYAMGPRRWIVAGRLFLTVALSYTAALALAPERKGAPLLALALPLATALAGVVPWVDGWARRERLRALGVLAAAAALRVGIATALPFERPVVTALIAVAGLVWLVLIDRTHVVAEPPPPTVRRLYEGDWLDSAVVPLGFITATVIALDASARDSGIVMAVAAAVVLVTAMRFREGTQRDAAVFATVLSAVVAVLLLEREKPLAITTTIALVGAANFAANRVWRSPSWTTLGAIGLTWAILASLVHLADREPYAYMPFATKASAVALVVLACVVAAWRLSLREEAKLELALRAGTVTWAFLWVHQEIALAFNATAATLFRVTYYAATSVAAVWIGRARGIALLRHVGLGLAILAAGTALYGAKNLAIAARIGADLVAAVFLLAIAYWYRRPGTGEGGQGKGLPTTAGMGEGNR